MESFVLLHALLSAVGHGLAPAHELQFFILVTGLALGFIGGLEEVAGKVVAKLCNEVVLALHVKVANSALLVLDELAHPIKSVDSHHELGLIFNVVKQLLYAHLPNAILPQPNLLNFRVFILPYCLDEVAYSVLHRKLKRFQIEVFQILLFNVDSTDIFVV